MASRPSHDERFSRDTAASTGDHTVTLCSNDTFVAPGPSSQSSRSASNAFAIFDTRDTTMSILFDEGVSVSLKQEVADSIVR